jgi:hypothetical protein
MISVREDSIRDFVFNMEKRKYIWEHTRSVHGLGVSPLWWGVKGSLLSIDNNS